MPFLFYLTLTAFIALSIILILLILIQKGRGGGLSSAFGGAGGSTAFGTKTGDVLTWATSAVFFLFILLAVALNWIVNYQHNQTASVSPTIVNTMPAIPTPATK